MKAVRNELGQFTPEWMLGKHLSEKIRKKISKAHKGMKFSEIHTMKGNTNGFKKGHIPWNKNKKGVYSDETRKKMGASHIGMCGENAGNWKGGMRKKNNERNDSAYQLWVSQVKKRDNNECAFKGQNCSGYLIVHHILPWRDYPELRYEIKNGITLCQYHHPRKRIDEQRLIPFFQERAMSKELLLNFLQQRTN